MSNKSKVIKKRVIFISVVLVIVLIGLIVWLNSTVSTNNDKDAMEVVQNDVPITTDKADINTSDKADINASSSPVQENQDNKEKNPESASKKDTDSPQKWRELYIDFLEENTDSDFLEAKYFLGYINDDDIPELIIDFSYTAGGGDVYTVSGDKLEVVHISTNGVYYIERRNLFLDAGGNMDVYYDAIYEIWDSKFKLLHKGEYGAEDNSNVQVDKNGEAIYRYYWDNKEVSKTKYEESLDSVFDVWQAVFTYHNPYTYEEIIDEIKDM